ncbi:MAG: COG1361 S-layer family protein [Methanotrichaceae archaeon]
MNALDLMKELMALFILLAIFAMTADGDNYYQAEGGPKLIVSSVDAKLESGRTGTVWVELGNIGVTNLKQNNNPQTEDEKMLAALEQEIEKEATEAIGIEAQLDGRDVIEVISGPQLAGSLRNNQRLERPMEFLVRVDENARAGIYPLALEVNYEQQSVRMEGDPRYPEIYFQREPAEEILPLNVTVVKGPEIWLDKVEGKASPGRESKLKFVLTNKGDEIASDVQVKLLPQPPFGWIGRAAMLGDLDPGKSTKVKFQIKVDRDVDLGDCILPYQVIYKSGQETRTEDLAALVEVKTPTDLKAIIVIPALAILLAALYFGRASKYLPKIRRRTKW